MIIEGKLRQEMEQELPIVAAKLKHAHAMWALMQTAKTKARGAERKELQIKRDVWFETLKQLLFKHSELEIWLGIRQGGIGSDMWWTMRNYAEGI
jgi:hypothetical protein